MKYCFNCEHLEGGFCTRDEKYSIGNDPVWGAFSVKITGKTHLASLERESDSQRNSDRCGPQAKFYKRVWWYFWAEE